jgi:hypothetical protein
MTENFRAALQKLLNEVHDLRLEAGNPSLRSAVTEARAALAQPEPPSLKEQALTALHAVATGANDTREQHQDLDTIRKALEQLNDE